jgi:uncharacterized membrane protein YjjP (DUF1212 family)
MSESANHNPAFGPDITNRSLSRDYNRVATLLDYLGRALLSLGSPAYRVERALTLFAEGLGANVQVMSTPTMLVFTMRDSSGEHTFMVRENPGPTNLGKLADLVNVMNTLAAGGLSIAGACQQAADVYLRPTRLSPLKALLAFMLSSASAALLLGGNYREMLLASLLGMISAGVHLLAQRSRHVRRLLIPLASVAIAFAGNVYCFWFPGTSYIEPIVGGLITFLPGLAITAATSELATGNVLSGSSRLAGAVVVLLSMIFGIAIGSTLADTIFGEPALVETQALAFWANYLLAPLLGIGLSIRFHAQLRDWPAIVLTCLAAIVAVGFKKSFMDPIVGAFAASAVIGVGGNLFAHITKRPGSIVHLPGILVLVPGSMSLFSIAALMQSDIVLGLEVMFDTMLTAMALATGLILASVIMPPKADL